MRERAASSASDVLAVTDHDTWQRRGRRAGRVARASGGVPRIIVASEVLTDQGDVIGLFLTRRHPEFTTRSEFCDIVHEHGGLALPPPPVSPASPRRRAALARRPDRECYNARTVARRQPQRRDGAGARPAACRRWRGPTPIGLGELSLATRRVRGRAARPTRPGSTRAAPRAAPLVTARGSIWNSWLQPGRLQGRAILQPGRRLLVLVRGGAAAAWSCRGSTGSDERALHRSSRATTRRGRFACCTAPTRSPGQGMMLARGTAPCRTCDARRARATACDWDGRGSRPGRRPRRARTARGDGRRRWLAAFLRSCRDYDVFHFHFGTSSSCRAARLVPLPARWASRSCSTSTAARCASARTCCARHRLSTCTECDPFCRPRAPALRLLRRTRADSLPFSRRSTWPSRCRGGVHLPLAIETERWAAARGARIRCPDAAQRDGVDGPVVIAHAPTNRLIKGTRHVVAAVERCAREFPRLELRDDRAPAVGAACPEFLARLRHPGGPAA